MSPRLYIDGPINYQLKLEPKGGYMCLFWNWVSPMVSLERRNHSNLVYQPVGKGQHKKLRLICNGRDRVYNLQRKLADLCRGVKDGIK
jgi:hypothetical protein